MQRQSQINSLSQLEQNRENHTQDMLSIERDRQENSSSVIIPERIDVNSNRPKIFKNYASTARGPAAPDTPGEEDK